MTSQNPNDENLPFRTDFAARVLTQADGIIARRRKMRDATAGMFAVVALGAVLFGASQMWLRSAPEEQRVPQLVASIDSSELPFPPDRQTTLLDIMFPHASAVAQFSDEYGAGYDTDGLEDDAVFFPNAKSVAENDT